MPIYLFTGLSGAGKSTLAVAIQQALSFVQLSVCVLDGDAYRQTICKDLGFSKADRIENLKRLGSVAASIETHYDVVIIAAISPYEEARQMLVKQVNAHIVWIKCSIETLTARDTKGLYKKAFLPDNHPEKITNLTGVNDVYEMPLNADVIVDTGTLSIENSSAIICKYILNALQQSVAKTLHSNLPTLHLQ